MNGQTVKQCTVEMHDAHVRNLGPEFVLRTIASEPLVRGKEQVVYMYVKTPLYINRRSHAASPLHAGDRQQYSIRAFDGLTTRRAV